MKNIVIAICCSITLFTACNDNKKEWADYNNAVVHEVKSADSVIQQLFTFKDFEQYATTQNNYVSALERNKNNLTAIQAPDSDDSLRLTAIELTNVYTEIASKDFLGIYMLMHDSIYTPADSISVDSLSDIMYSKWQIASEKFATMQKTFSNKYGIVLE